ncbi:unnamed protein product [Ectocarpus sp. 12 AP-2014]
MLIHPMNAFPWVINGIVEAGVSKTRLEKLLFLLPKGTAAVSCERSHRVGGVESDSDDDSKDVHFPLISWRGATVALSREREKRTSAGDVRSVSPVSDVERRAEIPGSLVEGSMLEPLLRPQESSAGQQSPEEQREGRGEEGPTPEFSLHGVSLEIRRGEAVAIAGGVGSGKSTLLAGILGELPVFQTVNADSTNTNHTTSSRSSNFGRDESEAALRGLGTNAVGFWSGVDRDDNSGSIEARRDREPARGVWDSSRVKRPRRRPSRTRRNSSGGQAARGVVVRGAEGRRPGDPGGGGRTTTTRVCYAAQNPWVMSGSVRENVLFGLPMDRERYREALDACALGADLASIPGGDTAYVGERGATLSGGQRLRVSLARQASKGGVCAYFVSAAAVADVAAKAAALGNNLPGDDDTKSGTTLADDHDGGDGGDGGDVHHSAGTLCLLDNPLTSLDAETREHVLQHCIHGVMRRGNPGVAVVVTCGEIDPAEKEQPTVTKERGATVPPLPLSRSIKRSFDRVVRLGGIGGEGTRPETAADAGEGRLPLPGADASAERRRAPPPAAATTSPSVLISAPRPASEAASSRPAAPGAAPKAAEKAASNLVEHASAGGGGGGGLCPQKQGAGRSSEGDGLADSSGDVLLPCGGSEALEAGDGNGRSGPVEEEDRKDGSVEFRVYLLYVRSAGLGVAAVTLLSLALMQATAAGFSYWLSHWATQQGRVSVRSFLATSFSIAAANAAFTLVR